jgi:hypothetical protein
MLRKAMTHFGFDETHRKEVDELFDEWDPVPSTLHPPPSVLHLHLPTLLSDLCLQDGSGQLDYRELHDKIMKRDTSSRKWVGASLVHAPSCGTVLEHSQPSISPDRLRLCAKRSRTRSLPAPSAAREPSALPAPAPRDGLS